MARLPQPSRALQLAPTLIPMSMSKLRGRLLKTAAAVVVVFIGLLPFSARIFSLVSAPLRDFLPGNQMIATEVASPLLTPFKLTFFVALFIAMPVVLYQLWAFVAPGLYKKD
jgi:sec-independent protein translocase protein TatC